MIVEKWESGLGDKKFIDNDQYPTIADIVSETVQSKLTPRGLSVSIIN